MDNSGQRYSPVLDNPPELHRSARLDDDLVELSVDHTLYDKLRLLWQERRLLQKFVIIGFAFFLGLVFVLPKRYESTVRIMPPQNQGGIAALAAMAGAKVGGTGAGGDTLGALAASLLGGATSGALIVALLNDR